MSRTDQLLSEIEAFLIKTGMAASTFGQKSMLNSKLVDRLRNGGTVTLETEEAIRAFMAENRPVRKRRRGNESRAAA